MSYIQDKLNEFDEKYKYMEVGEFLLASTHENMMSDIRNMFTDYHNHIVEKIEGMKLEIPEYRNKRGHHTNSAHMKIRHNKALQMVLSLLQDTNPKEL